MIARTQPDRRSPPPMGNYVSDRVGNYVSGNPLQLGNYLSADSQSQFLVTVSKDPPKQVHTSRRRCYVPKRWGTNFGDR
jgi:hypothetical protein